MQKKARHAMFGFGGPRCKKSMWLDTGDVMLGLGGPGCKKKYAAGHGGACKVRGKRGGAPDGVMGWTKCSGDVVTTA